MARYNPKSPSSNWPLRENIRQAFAGGPANAFQTMLRMLAATVPGGAEAQNAYIASVTGSSVRTVRRWRNQGTIPNGYPNHERVFLSLYRALVNRNTAFFPVGFRFMIDVWGKDAFYYTEFSDLYEQRLLTKFRNAGPLPLSELKKQVERALAEVGEGSSGSVHLVYEHAPDPAKVFEVTSLRVRRKKNKIVEHRHTYSEQGYLDFFDPYDLPMMTTKIASAIEAGGRALTREGIVSSLESLYHTLTFYYGFYSPGNTKEPHSRINPTASWMRWFERVINLLM